MKNTGKREGDEVVQVYATALNQPVPLPLRQLIGFQRVSFKAGETKAVKIVVPVERLHRWNEAEKRYVVDPSDYQIAAGPSSDQPVVKATLTILQQPQKNL